MNEQFQEPLRNVELISGFQVRYQTSWRPHLYTALHNALYHALEGTATFEIDGATYILNAGECLWIPADALMRLQAYGDRPFIARNFRIAIHDAKLQERMKRNYPPLKVDPTLKSMLTYLFEHKNDPDYDSRLTCEAFLRTILTLYFVDKLYLGQWDSDFVITDEYSPATKKLLHLVEGNFYRKFVLDEVSKELGYHKNYICSAFSRDTGVSFVEYVNFHRVRQAVVFFFFWNIDIAETSERLCFNSLSYFSRTFKKFVGIPPLDFFRACDRLSFDDRSFIARNEPVLSYHPMPIDELFASLRHLGETMAEVLKRKPL